jgi:hypothetical protein
MPAIDQLVVVASARIAGPVSPAAAGFLKPWARPGTELLDLLQKRNGFYAFLSALYVFPFGKVEGVMDLESWNAPSLWRQEYGDLAEGRLFFAEDVFGGQFCIKDGSVWAFDPETGHLESLGGSVEEWARHLLLEHDVLCGTQLARYWQERHGGLPPGKRLVPKMPFAAGGTFDLGNLYLGDAVEAMRFRGQLATKIRDLPDGAKVSFKVTD